MTKAELIAKLREFGFKDPESRYFMIRDFLKANRTPLKAITAIKMGTKDYEDDENTWAVLLELGEWFGWVEC